MTAYRRYFLELGYKGTNYHGWQMQSNAKTVQEVLERSLSVIFGEKTSIMGSGRTDTGVHARQQFAHFDCPGIEDKGFFLKKLNAVLPQDIAGYAVREVHKDAHARFAAKWRSYEYVVNLKKNPFEEETAWLCYYDLNLELMNKAAAALKEYTDFECFSKIKTDVKHFECEIKEAYWEQIGDHLIFHITANRFLRGMVRAIVGTMVLVGREKMSVEMFRQVIISKERAKAGASASAKGLFLTKVVYPEDIFI